MNEVPIDFGEENDNARGLHLAVINSKTGDVITQGVFDTFETSEGIDYFIDNGGVKSGDIIVATCQDDVSKRLSSKAKAWF